MNTEILLRGSVFLGVFIVIAIWEGLQPRRPRLLSRRSRWSANLGLLLVNSIALRLVFPLATVGMALSTAALGWGLFNRLEWPLWVEVTIAFILLDLAIYWQHRLTHQIPVLWRLHRMHHADLDFDCTTGLRFHTLEILLSMLYKWLVILLLGPAVLAVLIFEIFLNGMALFNHANASLPEWLERRLRWLLVTPDMHRVHHSSIPHETNSNYGFNLSCWDRLFGSYLDQPSLGHEGMQIGLKEYRDQTQVARLPAMLLIPFSAARTPPGSADSVRQ